MPRALLYLFIALGPIASSAWAEPPVIMSATLSGQRISVTLAHPDTGWDHYADGWQVSTPDGTELGVRVLHHPHVTEQPFTRSLTLDTLPPKGALVITAHDNLGHQSAPFTVTRAP